MIDANLKSVQAICSRWAWYARSGKYDTLNASRLVLPEPFPLNVVYLDATARQEVQWELLGKENIVRPELPEGVRSYANVTLNVARAGSVSKTTMKDKGKARLARLIEHLNKRFDGQADRKVFLVTHKAIEHHADDHILSFGKLSVAHWGSLDGKNEWHDHDVAVLFGLSYRMRIWANNLYQAIKGRQGTKWLQNNNVLRNEMEVKQLTAGIVQAMNRIQCRKTIDDRGNCKPCEIFLVLKEGNEGDAILEGIRKEMPGIVAQPWDFNIDGPRVTIRKGSSRVAQARSFYERALAADPDNVDALIGSAYACTVEGEHLFVPNPMAAFTAAEATLTKALSSVPDHARGHMLLGYVEILTRRAAQGIAECERALELDGNLANAHSMVGYGKIFVGRAEETEAHIGEALRLSPRDTLAYTWMGIAGIAKGHLGSGEQAVAWFRRAIEANRNYPTVYFNLAAALAQLGRLDESHSAVKAGLALNPAYTISRIRDAWTARSDDPTYLARLESILEGMRKAGVPEQ